VIKKVKFSPLSVSWQIFAGAAAGARARCLSYGRNERFIRKLNSRLLSSKINKSSAHESWRLAAIFILTQTHADEDEGNRSHFSLVMLSYGYNEKRN
jgi:hypothetical protein